MGLAASAPTRAGQARGGRGRDDQGRLARGDGQRCTAASAGDEDGEDRDAGVTEQQAADAAGGQPGQRAQQPQRGGARAGAPRC